MKTSEHLDKIGIAICKAQSEMGGAVKDSKNPFFKSNYASLTSVWKSCKEALHSNGLSVIQSPIESDGRIGVETLLLHESGQFITDKFTLGVKKQNDPQADGSSVTYARRYALMSFVGICPVDDDGEMSMHRKKKTTENEAMKSLEEKGFKELEPHTVASEYHKKFSPIHGSEKASKMMCDIAEIEVYGKVVGGYDKFGDLYKSLAPEDKQASLKALVRELEVKK